MGRHVLAVEAPVVDVGRIGRERLRVTFLCNGHVSAGSFSSLSAGGCSSSGADVPRQSSSGDDSRGRKRSCPWRQTGHLDPPNLGRGKKMFLGKRKMETGRTCRRRVVALAALGARDSPVTELLGK